MSRALNRIEAMRLLIEDLCRLDLSSRGLHEDVGALQGRAIKILDNSAAKKAKAVSLDLARRRAKESHEAKGRATRDRVLPIIKELRDQGVSSVTELAKKLDEMGIKPPRAKTWSINSILNIESRKAD